MHQLLRIAGVLTLGYGAAIAVSPQVMAKPCELTERDGSVSPSTATMIRALGVRDVMSGISLLVSPRGRALDMAAKIRIASDAGDGVLLGLVLPSKAARAKSAAVALGYAALCTAALAAVKSAE